MLWVPVGQHEFLLKHWMKVGTFMAPFLLMTALAFRQSGKTNPDPRPLALGLWVAYIVHQFEEHWVDLFGRRYAFKPYLNEALSGLSGDPDKVDILSDASVFVINTSLVWLVAALAVWRGCQHIFPTLCMAAIVLVNAISHIVIGTASLSYNPGLLTAVVVFLPVGGIVYGWLLRAKAATTALCGYSVLWALVGHVIMIGGLLLLARSDQPNEAAYFAILIAWSILPCFLFVSADRQLAVNRTK